MSIRTVAITGTNGKTSTMDFVGQLLDRLGVSNVSIGTLGITVASRRYPHIIRTAHADYFSALKIGIARQNFSVLLMEAFGQSLAAGNWDNVEPRIGVLTNFGHDHLDVHGSIANYWVAKRRLFANVLPSNSLAIFHANRIYSEELLTIAKERDLRVFLIGADGMLYATEVHQTLSSTQFVLHFEGQTYKVKVPFFGEVFIDNLLLAIGIVLELGQDIEAILPLVPGLKLPPGRLEVISLRRGTAIVDYAHSPDALDSLINSVAPLTPGRLHLLLGCGGERDSSKRKPMGVIASRVAGSVFVTDDNPRGENAASIRQAILEGCPKGTEIAGREEAIRRAISVLEEDDILLITGRGHEGCLDIPTADHSQLSDQSILKDLVQA